MITIYAEKPDMGTKIAAALDGIYLDDGRKISFQDIEKYDKLIKFQRTRDGFFRITWQGKETYVTWGYGHMCELMQAYDYNEEYRDWEKIPLPYIPSSYDLKLTGPDKQYNTIYQLFQSSEYIINATDNDREGDLIFDYLYRFMGCVIPYKRAIFNKQAQEEFRKSFAYQNLIPSQKRMPIIEAGRARGAGDFIVGAGPSVAMTLKYSGNGLLSVGRVQTAVLTMIVKRENEIKNFKPTNYWVVNGKFQAQDGTVYLGIHEKKRFDKKQDANDILNKLVNSNRIGIVTKVEKKKSIKKKPFLYNTQTIQMDANKKFGYSLDRTLDILQSLYNKGIITYPRTDSVHLPNDMAHEMQDVLHMLLSLENYRCFDNGNYINPNDKHYFDSSKIDGHYAIVPTKKQPGTLPNDEQNLYNLIALHTICMIYPNATMGVCKIITECENEQFLSSGNIVIDKGFFEVLGTPKENLIPNVQEGDRVSCEFSLQTKKTEPPKHYTDATLLNAMINCGKNLEDDELKELMANGPGGKPRGLGRPSSQASIVDTLVKRLYVERKNKTILPTQKGIDMIASFPVEELKSAIMTAEWEKRLDDIELGKDSYQSFMNDLENKVRLWTTEIINMKGGTLMKKDNVLGKCPHCGGDVITGLYGAYCANQCGANISKVFNYEIPQDAISSLLAGNSVFANLTGRKVTIFPEMIENHYNGKTYYNWKTEDGGFEVYGNCPHCNGNIQKGKFGYYCANKCGVSIDKVFGKKLTEGQIKNLLNGKKVSITVNKNKLTVFPEIEENEYNGKTYYNWKTERQ